MAMDDCHTGEIVVIPGEYIELKSDKKINYHGAIVNLEKGDLFPEVKGIDVDWIRFD